MGDSNHPDRPEGEFLSRDELSRICIDGDGIIHLPDEGDTK